jgi:hypothetical protein
LALVACNSAKQKWCYRPSANWEWPEILRTEKKNHWPAIPQNALALLACNSAKQEWPYWPAILQKKTGMALMACNSVEYRGTTGLQFCKM